MHSKNLNNSLYSCYSCDIKKLYPIPESKEITQGLYKDIVEVGFNEKQMSRAIKSVEFYNYLINKYTVLKENKIKVLDIGGGLGYYSEAFSRKGYDVTYFEGDRDSYSFASKNHNNIKNFIFGDNLEILLEKDNFDVIFCRHVIEHIYYPKEFIFQICSLLNKNGILIMETDNNNSEELLTHPLVRNYWADYYLKNYDVKNLNALKKTYVTALSAQNTHWWSFNVENLSQLIGKNMEIFYSMDYHLGDEFLWDNVQNFKKIKDYFNRKIIMNPKYWLRIYKYIKWKKHNQGAGILILARKK